MILGLNAEPLVLRIAAWARRRRAMPLDEQRRLAESIGLARFNAVSTSQDHVQRALPDPARIAKAHAAFGRLDPNHPLRKKYEQAQKRSQSPGPRQVGHGGFGGCELVATICILVVGCGTVIYILYILRWLWGRSVVPQYDV